MPRMTAAFFKMSFSWRRRAFSHRRPRRATFPRIKEIGTDAEFFGEFRDGPAEGKRSMAWALNSDVYCFLGLLGVMSGFWYLLVQNSNAPQYGLTDFIGMCSCVISRSVSTPEKSYRFRTPVGCPAVRSDDFRRWVLDSNVKAHCSSIIIRKCESYSYNL